MKVDVLGVWETAIPNLQCQGHAYVKVYILIFVEFFVNPSFNYYLSLSRHVFKMKS